SNIISILGIQAELVPIQRSELKGLNVDLLLRFDYYAAIFNHQDLCIIQAKNNESLTPLKYRKITEQIESITGMPVVILIESLAYYERERLINQGVYFIVSDKYAFLPALVSNVKVKEKGKQSVKLIPAAQYILLYYLLSNDGKAFSIRELEAILPYNYLAISRAIINLEDLRLCEASKDDTRTKIIHFGYKRELWEKSQKHLSSPVKKILYSDSVPEGDFSISGINALSRYSHLNPEQYGSVAIWDRMFSESFALHNEIEGNYKIEIWKYPVFMSGQPDNKIVDKLSLYLSMKDNPDARVEKELEILIENIQW
ncbi:MAG: hypothetical protein LBV74_05625, partial [Tannerella sp.]|nr:hypothetical protein [Tannerella sp.]